MSEPYRSAPFACKLCGIGVGSETELSVTDRGWACEGCFKKWSGEQDANYQAKLGWNSAEHPFWRSRSWKLLRAIIVLLVVFTGLMAIWGKGTRWRRIHRQLEPDKYEREFPYAPKE